MRRRLERLQQASIDAAAPTAVVPGGWSNAARPHRLEGRWRPVPVHDVDVAHLVCDELEFAAMQIVGGVDRMHQVLYIAKCPHVVVSMNDSGLMTQSHSKTIYLLNPLCYGIASVVEYVGVICPLAWAISTLNHQHGSF